ncbi:hypothetical protein [Streptomyces sp. NPDC094032]|uniref:hypothetical protein n=1 Tax=Streptomyces sp. NPDC094032 TaxID=3155308 RepID=UPI00333351A9
MAWYEGPCRITVIGVDADWPQRAVVTVRGPGGARIVVPGTVGAVAYVDAPSWDLALEHEYEGMWRPNVRAVTSRWTEVGGVPTQTVRSKDADQPRDRRERNLVLRLERTAAPADHHRPAEAEGDRTWSHRRPTESSSPSAYGSRTTGASPTSSTGTSTTWHVPRQRPGGLGTSGGGTGWSAP